MKSAHAALLIGGLLPLASLAAVDLERELNGLELEVQVLEARSNDAGQVARSALAVMVANRGAQAVYCKLLVGDIEAAPDLQEAPLRLIEPGQRAVLELAGEHGDPDLQAKLVCHPDGEQRTTFE